MSTGYATGNTDQDEVELQRHLVATRGGRCDACGEQEPCSTRQRLAAALADAGHLPRRRPGEVGQRMFHPPARPTETTGQSECAGQEPDRTRCLSAGGQGGALVDEIDVQE